MATPPGPDPAPPDGDHVARVLRQWARERPDLDVSPIGLVARVHRIGARLTEELVAEYAKHGLDEGEFDVLATLRRSGPPHELSPTELGTASMVSSGAITKRVDRCVRKGLATRRPGTGDARTRVVALTPAGRALIDRAFTAHVANEQRLVADLAPADRARLAGLLEAWARALGV